MFENDHLLGLKVLYKIHFQVSNVNMRLEVLSSYEAGGRIEHILREGQVLTPEGYSQFLCDATLTTVLSSLRKGRSLLKKP